MRIVTWNVNGIKTLLQYHPWNQKRTYEGIIEDLGGDITCIQETKITRAQMDKGMACMDKYDSFFSFYRRGVRGIHGTAIFTKRDVVVPQKAEEGIGSSLLPATMTATERIGGYPLSSQVDLDYNGIKDLDVEGRTTIVDTGMFVLINLYCPNETNEERLVFKNAFNKMVDARVKNLIKQGREVIVVGDLNICASNLDTAEPDQRAKNQGLEEFTDHPPRKWLKEFTGPGGVMIDTTRVAHPDRIGMFTCWNTKIDARPSNYGTRLDYILVTPGLLPWIKDADIQRDIVGSDHCPVYLDFHDSIELPDRGTVRLWDELNAGRTREDTLPEPPAFACKFYTEFSGKQKLLSSFFGKGAVAPSPATAATNKETDSKLSKRPANNTPQPVPSSSKTVIEIEDSPSPPPPIPDKNRVKGKKGKGKEVEDDKPKSGQKSLSSFFRPTPTPEPEPAKKKRKKSVTPSTTSVSDTPKPKKAVPDSGPSASSPSLSQTDRRLSQTQDDRPDDDDLFILDDDSTVSTSSQSFTAEVNAQAASVWQNVFATKSAPLCEGHKEPTKMWTVNKPGINKGRKFYLCARPVGPGYDKGQAKINVNPEFRCDHFEWATKVLRPAGMVENMSNRKSK